MTALGQRHLSRRGMMAAGAALASGALGLAAGCVPGGGGQQPPAAQDLSGSVTIWSYTTQSIPQRAIDDFTRANPRVSIEQLQPAGDGLLRQGVDGVDAVEQGEPIIGLVDDGDAACAVGLGELNEAHGSHRGVGV